MRSIGSALVTGGSGFIGARLVRRLAESGARVSCAVRSSSGPTLEHPNVTRVQVGDAEELRRYLVESRCDTVFNLASYGVKPGDRDPYELIDGNLGLLTRVLDASRLSSVERVVHAGSCSEYAPLSEPELLTEAHPAGPTNLYGAAKLAAQLYGNSFARLHQIPMLTLRLFGSYGPGEAPHRLIPHIVHHLSRGLPAEVSSGVQQRDFMHVDDVVEALLLGATHPALELHAVYNVCTGRGVPVRQLMDLTVAALAAPRELLQIGTLPLRSGEAAWMVGDPTRFNDATGFQPRIDLDRGVEATVRALLERNAS